MDLDDFRSILDTAGVDVWLFIDTAISVASLDNAGELKQRRDGIVERLYAATTAPPLCQNCEGGGSLLTDGNQIRKQSNPSLSPEQNQRRGGGSSPPTPQSQGNEDDEDDEIDPYGGLFEDEQKKILEIKELLEDPRQSEDSLLELLQNLVDIDITFQELKETDIGRNVNQLRKHPSSDVRRLVKLLVKKWKEIVDEWVKLNPQGGKNTVMADGDSPLQKTTPNGHYHQIPDFAYSPNPQNGSSGSATTVLAVSVNRSFCSMAMRSALSRGIATRSMDSTSRGAFTRFFSNKGKVLSEEEQAKENVYIQKWERERLEKQKQAAEKAKAERAKESADDKKSDGTQKS